MLAESSRLAQLRPSNTNANLLFSADLDTEITAIIVCNTTSTAARFSLYHDDEGATYDADTKLYHEKNVPGQDSFRVEVAFSVGAGISVAPGGNVAVQTDTANALNFTAYGKSARQI